MRGAFFIVALALLPAIAVGQNSGGALRFDVDLVQVDAVVTDRHGRHMANLKQEDFQVFQDGKPQKITHFSYVRAAPRSATQSPVQESSQPARSEVRRTIAIIIDDAAISFGDFHLVVSALERYIGQDVLPGDLVCIVRTSGGSGAWEQFTADKLLLRKAVDRMIWRPALPGVYPSVLGELNLIIAAMGAMPGRKSIVLVGPALPTPPGAKEIVWDAIRQIGDRANRASVTVQTVDARGLPTLMPSAAVSDPTALSSLPPWGLVAPNAISQRLVNYTDSQSLYFFLADVTGGLFQHDHNDILRQLENAADDSEGYYLIGWYPGADAFVQRPREQPRYHRIQIKLAGDDLTVRSRSGYFAFPGTAGPPVLYTAGQEMQDALFSPFRNGDIDVRLTASFEYDRGLGPYIESKLHVLPKGIEFFDQVSRPGCKTAAIELLITPEPLDWRSGTKGRIDGTHSGIELCGKALEGVLVNGFVVVDRRPIGEPGDYQMREAVRNISQGEAPSVGPKGLLKRDIMEAARATIGSANQLIDVPDLRKVKLALTGITLWTGKAPVEDPEVGFSYRQVRDGDPAVRDFHPGESLTYSFRIVKGKKAASSDRIEIRTKVLCDGKQIFESAPAVSRLDAPFTGAYQLPVSAAPERCALGVIASDDRDKDHPVEQWIDFRVRN